MTQLDDLNAKITAINSGLDNIATALTKASTDEQKAIADLKAAILAAGTGSAPDLTQQLQALDSASSKIAALATAVSGIDVDVLAADPSAVVPPPAA